MSPRILVRDRVQSTQWEHGWLISGVRWVLRHTASAYVTYEEWS